jgi:hypothetical protein
VLISPTTPRARRSAPWGYGSRAAIGTGARSIGSILFTGAPQRRYEIAPGTEGIAFGNAGTLAIRVWVMAAFCAAALPVTRTLRQPSRVT